MQKINFDEIVNKIRTTDSRYDYRAYTLVREALDYTLKTTKRSHAGHISCKELLEGIRDHTLKQYGPMSKTLLDEWGLTQTRDFGNIVFQLIENGVFGKNDQDQIEDFDNVWTFEEAFETPFKPKKIAEVKLQSQSKAI